MITMDHCHCGRLSSEKRIYLIPGTPIKYSVACCTAVLADLSVCLKNAHFILDC